MLIVNFIIVLGRLKWMKKSRQIAIEKNAENVRDECNITDYGFKDIFEASERLRYRTIRYPIGTDTFLGFAMIKDSERIVFSNSSLILSREIFSVAHEIGHQRLHLNEHGKTLIKDNDFTDRDELEVEANYFAACLLMPIEKVEKFVRLELKDKEITKWNGFDIAKIQTAFNVSYDMALIRLRSINILNDVIIEKLKIDKIEKTASKLLNVIGGNTALCRVSESKKVPSEFLEWVITNYNERLIPKTSLANALNYVDLCPDDVDINDENVKEDKDFDDLLGGMD
jgi:Zn-dependent peptidase ImmA (M78 family)